MKEAMRNWLYLLISVAALAQAAPPADVEITFELRRNGLAIAEVIERLEHGNGNYRLIETWKGLGIFRLLGRATRTSKGMVAPDGLRPREFTDERSGRDTARAWFDWKGKVITMQYKGRRHSVPLPPDAQDRLSFLLAFSFLEPGEQSITFNIADGKGGLSRHVYRVVGRERLRIPAGAFDTVKLVRQKKDERAEIWLAIEHSQLPVRVLVTEEDGTRYEHVAIKISSP